MSRIEKLSIQGIRSFNPEASEKMDIFTPVTLILGANGTGKTTIVECLKYATTGELPPGTKVGGCFVHDPKLAQEVEVKAKVGLSIKDISGRNMIISRSLLATQKAKTIQMRTLDGVIKRQLPSGEVNSISSKCAELDREMVSSLGVSKPVLENVIFCHQEESNWPLSEGKAVKQRFDDIFASTRYVKALETIRKTKMEQDQNVKVQKTSVAHLKEQTAKAAEVSADLDEAKTRLAAEEHSLGQVNEKLEPLQQKLHDYHQRYEELCSLESKLKSHEHEKKILTEAITKLRSNIRNDFEGPDAKLRAVIESAAESLGAMEQKSSACERQLVSQRRTVDRLQNDRNRLLIEKGKQEQERQNYEQHRQRLRELTEEYSRKEGLAATFDSEATIEDHERFLTALESKLKDGQAEMTTKRAHFEEREVDVQKDLDRQRGSISRLEESKKKNRQLLERHQRDLRQVQSKLAAAEDSVEKLALAQGRLKEAEAAFTGDEGAETVKILKREIEADKVAMAAEAGKMEAIEARISQVMAQAEKVAQRTVLETAVKEKESSVRRLRAKLADSLELLFCGDVPSERLRAQFEAKLADLTDANRRKTEEVQCLRGRLTTCEAELKATREAQEAKRQRLRALDAQLEAVCGRVSFEEALRQCREKKKTIEEEHAFIQGSVATFRKFKDRLDRDHACPLCHRDFASSAEELDLSEELQQKLSLVPRELRTKEEERRQVNKRYDELMRLDACPEERRALAEVELPQLQKALADKQAAAARLASDVESGASVLEQQRADEAVAKAIQGDIVVLDRFEAELRIAGDKLSALKAATASEGGSASLEELQKEKAEVKTAIQAIQESTDDKWEAIESANKRLERLRTNVERLREECRNLERLNADKVHLAKEAEKLTAESARLESEVAEEESRFPSLRNAILALEKERKEVKGEKEALLEDLRRRDMALRKSVQTLENHVTYVQNYLASGKDLKLRQLHRKIEEKEATVKEEEAKIAEGDKELEKIKADISNHKMRQRELSDCLEVREKEAVVRRLEEQMDSVREKLGGHRESEVNAATVRQLQREERKLLEQQQLLVSKKAELIGRTKQLEKELASSIYRDAQKKYTGALHELKTTETAVSDLEKYYRALDRAIMSYHAFKMEEINKIIKELWRNTYKGNDIDFIEIRSDEDESGLQRSRRTYNYRVVMVKADTALDMRGRCSAGQKVLASLIIRLALAEAFCLKCGVLALDEPTTNLDRENIESLAYALVEIIKARSKQKNFQLIVITHDADFVELLGRSEFVEDFFRVSRNADGLSQIRKLKIEEEFR